MGTKQKLNPDALMFDRTPLHKRTIDGWAATVCDRSLLVEKIREEVGNIVWNKCHWMIRSQSADTCAWMLTVHDSIKQMHSIQFGWNKDDTSFRAYGIAIHNDKPTSFSATDEDLIVPSSQINWFEPAVRLMTMYALWAAFIEGRPGLIPGTDFNITIVGCVRTCFSLGVPIEL